MQKSSVAPAISIEESAHYDSLELLVENQAFLPRELQHPLNTRKAPTVSSCTCNTPWVIILGELLGGLLSQCVLSRTRNVFHE